jgi:hypothetical protein
LIRADVPAADSKGSEGKIEYRGYIPYTIFERKKEALRPYY